MPSFDDTPFNHDGLLLRPLREQDLPLVVQACSDEQTQRWLPLPSPYTLDDARSFAFEMAAAELASGTGIEWAVEREGGFCGVVGLHRTDWEAHCTEAGYWMGPWARGRGIAPRALDAVTRWAMEQHGMERMEVRAATGNLPSQRVALKAGFLREGVLRRAGTTHDGPVDLVVFGRVLGDPPMARLH